MVGVLLLIGGCAGQAKAPAKVGGNYAFWPDPPDPPRVQFLVAFNSSADIEQGAKKGGLDQLIYGKETQEVLGVAKPYGVAVWDGRIYVCDIRGSGGVVVLDLKKQQTRVMGASGSGAITKAVDVAVAPDGVKYVVDQSKSSVMMFDANERYVRSFVFPDSGPVSAAVYGNELFVADFKAQHVKVVDRQSGRLLRVIGSAGSEDGQFVAPLCVAFDKEGNLLVSDVITCRIQKFTREGQFISRWGESGDRPGAFVRPKHLDASSDGVTYVVDAAFNNVQLFDEEGKVMMFFGSAGKHPGAMDLPAGLAITENDLDVFAKYVHPAFKAEKILVVTNQFGPHRVAVYAIGQLKEGFALNDLSSSRVTVTAGTLVGAAATQPASAGLPTEVSPDALNKNVTK